MCSKEYFSSDILPGSLLIRPAAHDAFPHGEGKRLPLERESCAEGGDEAERQILHPNSP